MTAEAVPMAAGMQEIPVVFTAAADAPPAGALVGIIGKTIDPKLNVVGRLDQRTMLVRGQNNSRCVGAQRRPHGDRPRRGDSLHA